MCLVQPFDLTLAQVLPALDDVQVVLHAARVHVMNETVLDALADFPKVNVEGTLRLVGTACRRIRNKTLYLRQFDQG